MKDEEHVKIHGGLREEIGMKTYLHGPMDYAKTLKLRFRVGIWTCQKEEVYQYSRGGGRRCTDVPLWQSSRVELTFSHNLWENVKYTRRNGMLYPRR